MSDSNILKQVFDLVDRLTKDSDGSKSLLIGAVEIDENGFPTVKAIKCSGSPAQSIAGIDLLQRMLDETLEEVHERIKLASDASSKIEELGSKLGKLMDGSDDGVSDEESQRIRDMINEFRKRLGK